MTEEEAKQRWCPFARVIPGDRTEKGSQVQSLAPGPFNRLAVKGETLAPYSATCLASACMAWRQAVARSEIERSFTDQCPAGWDNATRHCEPSDLGPGYWSRRVEVPAEGYCGLAGAPHP